MSGNMRIIRKSIMPPQVKNKIGKRYGKLKVVKYYGSNATRHAIWECKCDCGKTCIATSHILACGSKKSCGCLQIEAPKKMAIHGLHNHPLYATWSSMISRCHRKNNRQYKNYGFKGISVCDEWRKSVVVFYNYAITHGWKYGLQVDRIDTTGNYEPGNIRFVDGPTNQRNKLKSKIWVVHNKEYETLSEASKDLNVSACAIYNWCSKITKSSPSGCYFYYKYKQ